MNAIVEVNSYLASSHVIPPGVFMAYKIGTLAKNGLISNKMKSYNRSNDNLCDKKTIIRQIVKTLVIAIATLTMMM